MRNRGIRGEQWSRCSRCGFDFPMSMLTSVGGLLLDAKCVDDQAPARHAKLVQNALEAAGAEPEGVDTRSLDLTGFIEEDL